ncbi:hypothetical protein ACKUVQ_00315 [Mycobacterium seoulense]
MTDPENVEAAAALTAQQPRRPDAMPGIAFARTGYRAALTADLYDALAVR